MRMRAVATIASIAAALLGPLAAPAAAATMTAGPSRAVSPATITVSGSCDPVRPGSTVFPRTTTLTLDGAQPATKPVPVASDGTFTGAVPVSPGLAPGAHVLASDCGGRATVTVLAAPTLLVTPGSVRAPARVSATGTCAAGSGARTRLFLAGRSAGTAAVDPVTGEFGPLPLAVPDGLGPGRLGVTSSCGGSAVLGLLAAPATTPAATTLAGTTPIPTANPSPGTAPPTTAPIGSWPVTLVLAGMSLLLLLGLLTALLRTTRLRRQRRWLDECVRVDAGTAAWHPLGTARADVPGVEVDLLVHREPPVFGMAPVSGTKEVGGRE